MVTIIAATNREKSLSFEVAKIYQQILADLSTDSEILSLVDLPNDFAFSALYDNQGKQESFNHFIQKINACHKFVFIIPEYNGSFPGVLKAFIDGMDYPDAFKGDHAGLVGISSGAQGASLGLSHFADIMNYIGCYLVPIRPRCVHIDKKLSNGNVDDKLFLKLMREQAEALLAM